MLSINEFFAVAPAALAAITPVIIMALAIGYFFKNPILLRSLLWERVMGRKIEIHDPTLEKAMKDQMDLNQIRSFIPGYRLRNIYHARAVIEWCKENEIGHDELSGMDQFVFYTNCQITMADKSYNLQNFFCAIIFFVAALAFMPAAAFTAISGITHGVLAKGRESGAYFLIDADRIVSANPFVKASDGWVLDRTSCMAMQAVENPLTQKEREAVCRDLESGEIEKYVDENFNQNFYALFLFAATFMAIALGALYQNSRYTRFKELRRKVMEMGRRECWPDSALSLSDLPE